MTQGFNIARFSTLLNSKGIQRNNKFLVRFTMPILMKQFINSIGDLSEATRNMEFYTDSAALPGIALQTHSVLRYGTGMTEEKPFMASISPIRMSHLVDATDNQSYFYMRSWVNLILNTNLSSGINTVNGTSQAPFELSYKYEYVTDINILAFNDKGDVTRDVILRDAYPKAIEDLPLNWADNQNAMRLMSTIVYTDWYENNAKTNPPNNTYTSPSNTPEFIPPP